MAINPEISTLEVAISSNAETAIGNLERLAKKLTSLGTIISNTVTAANGLADIGKVNTSNITSVLTAAKNLAKEFENTERHSKRAKKSVDDVTAKKTAIKVDDKELKNASDVLDHVRDKIKDTVFAKGNGIDQSLANKAQSMQKMLPAVIGQDYTKTFGADTYKKFRKEFYDGQIRDAMQSQSQIKRAFANGLGLTSPLKDASDAARGLGNELDGVSKKAQEASARSESLFGTGGGVRKHRTGSVKEGFSREEMERREASGQYSGARKGMEARRLIELQKQTAEDYQTATKHWNAAKAIWDRIKAMREAAAAEQEEIDRLNAYNAAVADQEAYNKRLQRAFSSLGNAIRSVMRVIGKIPTLFGKAASAARSLAKGLMHPIATLKNLLGVGNRGGGILGGLLRGRSLGQFVGLIVLRRVVMATLRAIVNGIKEGFENIRNYSSAINSEMYSIQNSLLYVKNAWAAAFAPIVSVVRPYINYLLDAIAAALNALGRLMALLTGKGFAVQAVKLSDAMYEAGQAGEAAAGGTRAANKAAQEYKKTLMSFDQLHVLNAQDSGSGSGGSGGGGGGGASGGLDASQMFTTVSVAGAMKDAIESQDWDELGRLMAEKVNSAFGKLNELISWENVGGKITETVNAITTTLNSLVDNIDWNLIGTTFGSGINTLVNTWNLFFDGFDFVNLGKKLATGVNGLFDRIDWHELGRAVTQKFKALWETIYGFVTTLRWGDIGTKIGGFVNGALDNINLGTVASSVATSLNGIKDAIKNFSETVEWDKVSGQISDFFGTFFDEFDVNDFIVEIGEIGEDILGALADAAKKNKDGWYKFGEQVGEGIKNLPWEELLKSAAEIIVNTLGSLIAGLAAGLMPEGMRERWEELGWLPNFDSEYNHSPGSSGTHTHGGSGRGFGSENAPTSSGTTSNTSLSDQIADDFNNYAQEYAPRLQNSIGSIGKVAFEKFCDWINKGNGKEKGNELVTGAESGAKSGRKPLNKTVGGIASKVLDLFDIGGETKKSGKSSVDEFGKGASNQKRSLTNALKFMATVIAPNFNLDKYTSKYGSSSVTTFGTNAKNKNSWLSTTIKGIANATGALFNIDSTTKSRGSSAVASFGSGALGNQATVKNNTSTIMNAILALMNIGTDANAHGSKAIARYAEGINGKVGTAKTAGTKAANAVKASLGSGYNDGYTLGQSVVKGINAGIKSLGVAKLEYKLTKATVNGQRVVTGLNPTKSYIQLAASGGLLDTGQLYIARESGPELVGKIGNKNAVANNQQIVNSVAQGVEHAVYRAMSANNNSNNSSPYEIHITVKTQNDEVLARAVERGNAKRKYRLGTAVG